MTDTQLSQPQVQSKPAGLTEGASEKLEYRTAYAHCTRVSPYLEVKPVSSDHYQHNRFVKGRQWP